MNSHYFTAATNTPVWHEGLADHPQQLAEANTVIPAYPQSADARKQHTDLQTSASSTDREGIAFLILSGEYLGFLPTHFAARWVRKTDAQHSATKPFLLYRVLCDHS